ncbi:MAG: Glu-tRNA(Gln) amidotransferase subunit GatD [Candidatus Aenigmarchaeota archaeon]|nr:Glu-tRNA(Gln) amidotransferase subunit GatD [Candidatus Aenigmarchaeota archaeon]
MYSNKIESLLKRKKIGIGDNVSISRGKESYEGILMPQTDLGDPDTIIIKLGSGYNIGLDSKGIKITKNKGSTKNLGKTKNIKLKFNKKKPPISLIATGGTIASRVNYKTGGVYALEKPEEFLQNIPELENIVNITKSSKPLTKMSEDMDNTHWQSIAKAVAKELNSGAKGVIVSHGTDYLHYTAAALSFFLKNLSKPVVLVGSQRSSDRGSSDAGVNLICAAHVATSDMAEVGICMHGSSSDDYCLFNRGTKVRKMDTQRRDAFRPINDLPLAKIYPDGKIEKINSKINKRTDKKVEVDAKFEPKVALLKVYPGADPAIINWYVSKGYKGFVIEGSGLGHVPTQCRNSWTEVIKKYTKKGIPFVIAPQTLYGRINESVYTNLRLLYKEAGAISGQDMLPETAYVKLGWILGHTSDLSKVREMISTNYAGEISKRTLPGTFLY